MTKKIMIKLNVPLNGLRTGSIVEANTSYWQRRLKDAEKDNCVSIYKKPKKGVENDTNK